MRLADEVAIISGATKGMGRAMAERFAREGASVIVAGRSEGLARSIAEGLRAEGRKAQYVVADVTREDDVKAIVAAAVEHFGKLTIIVNNATPTERTVGPDRIDDRVEDITTEHWDMIFTGALKSAFWGCKYAIPEIARAGGGAIVNISSIGALLGIGGQAAYTAAKAAILGLTRSVAVETADRNIRANCIIPGAVPTALSENLTADPVFATALQSLQLTRLGQPDDIANVALFLASKEAAFITGLMMPVDGGATAKMPLPAYEIRSQD